MQYCLHLLSYAHVPPEVELVLQLQGLFLKSAEVMPLFTFLLRSPWSSSCRFVNQWYNIHMCSQVRPYELCSFFTILWIFVFQNLEILMQKNVFCPNFVDGITKFTHHFVHNAVLSTLTIICAHTTRGGISIAVTWLVFKIH